MERCARDADTPDVEERAGEVQRRGPRTDEELCEFCPAPLSRPSPPVLWPSDGSALPAPPPAQLPSPRPPATSSSCTTTPTPTPSPVTTAAATAPRSRTSGTTP